MIRKLRKIKFSILELIDNGTISIDGAAYLIFNLFHKRNIIIIGAPGSGKTTLINALDSITPNHWRKIYIEDVIESIDQVPQNKHQIRISTKSIFKSEVINYSKDSQVRESLHRTPDMIYLGEMISKSSIKAFFFLLKVGLRCGLCTSHGESPELMIKRWLLNDEVSLSSINDIDLIVQISKISDINETKRRIIRISEIQMDFDSKFKILSQFERDTKKDELKNIFGTWKEIFENGPVINKIRNSRIENLEIDDFLEEIDIFKSILSRLLDKNKLNDEKLNELLNKFWILRNKNQIKNWNTIKNRLLLESSLGDD